MADSGGRPPFRAMTYLNAADYRKNVCVLSVNPDPHCACEGNEQRGVPTGMASGDNEIKQHRDFSDTHFPGVASCGSRPDGQDGGAVWDRRPGVCYPAGGAGLRGQLINLFMIFTDSVAAAALSFEIRKLSGFLYFRG